MNITTTGTRTVLAAAAAGALILGSAGGSVAAPDKAQGPKDPKPGFVKITKVDIHKHKKINLDEPYGDLMLRVKVRDTTGTENPDPYVEGVTLALFASKKAEEPIAETGTVDASENGMKERGKKKKWYTYKFVASGSDIGGLTLPEGMDKAFLCISAVTTDVDMMSRQTKQRLSDDGVKKTVRECVKVYDMPDEVTSTAEPTS
jgi:hypothetical protein